MAEQFILALDQGTTSSRAVIFNRRGGIVGLAARAFPQIYPRPGWVEHDPLEIWASQKTAFREALKKAGISPGQIAAVGIASQRETTLVWDRESGRPLHNAVVWQCRRTAERCSALRDTPFARKIRGKTGLIVDAYFSGTKLEWILRREKGIRRAAEKGGAVFGTVDTWLAYLLSGKRLHVTDYSNASRTLLFNIRALAWDREILDFFSIPEKMLPAARPSSGIFGSTAGAEFGGAEVPLAGIAGDQQSALFGQACFRKGQSKNTYGTGCFLLMNTGGKPVPSKNHLLTTVAWGIGAEVEYALEGSVFIAGAAVQWLRDGVGMLTQAAESEGLAKTLRSNEGVYFVPAFVGLGAPYWDMYARGTLLGITRGTTRAHLARAALEAIAYQTRDVLESMEADSGIRLKELRVDGGAAANDFLLQFQADILGVPVIVPQNRETTALGAAYLAGLAVGFWRDREEIAGKTRVGRRYLPAMRLREREALYQKWKRAVARAKEWEK